jgi:hypothetical protein
MAHFHLPLRTDLAERTTERRIVEQRIVAETVPAVRYVEQFALDLSAKRAD